GQQRPAGRARSRNARFSREQGEGGSTAAAAAKEPPQRLSEPSSPSSAAVAGSSGMGAGLLAEKVPGPPGGVAAAVADDQRVGSARAGAVDSQNEGDVPALAVGVIVQRRVEPPCVLVPGAQAEDGALRRRGWRRCGGGERGRV